MKAVWEYRSPFLRTCFFLLLLLLCFVCLFVFLLREFIFILFPMPEPGAEKWRFEWLDLGAVGNDIIWTRGEKWMTTAEFCPRELGYAFRKCEIYDQKIAGALTASREGSFILRCVSCALCCLNQAMSLPFPPSPPHFLGKRLVFSHLNYVSVAFCQPDVVCCKERGEQNWKRVLYRTVCHSKICIAVLREGRRIQNSWGHNYTFSDSNSLAKSTDIIWFFLAVYVLT